MSKERARRRAEREAAAAAAAARRARQAQIRARRARVRAGVGKVARVVPRGRRRPDSALARHRRRQNGVLAALLLAANGALWVAQPSWGWRLSALVASVVTWPLLAIVFFDRRASL